VPSGEPTAARERGAGSISGPGVVATPAAVVAVSHLDKIYKTLEGADIEALKNVSFAIGAGEFVTVVGPSGCGRPRS
jgi:NitT/TauT family transport system ATP-binding protein